MDSIKLRRVLGRVIRGRRAFLGFSQEGFADKVGIHRTYMGAIERGERNMTLSNLVKLADAFGISPSQLLVEAEKAMKSEGPRK